MFSYHACHHNTLHEDVTSNMHVYDYLMLFTHLLAIWLLSVAIISIAIHNQLIVAGLGRYRASTAVGNP